MHSNNTTFLLPHSHTFNFLTSCFTSLCVYVCPLTTYWPLKLSSFKKTQKTMFCLSLHFSSIWVTSSTLFSSFLVYSSVWSNLLLMPSIVFKNSVIVFFNSIWFLFIFSLCQTTCRAMYCVIWGYIMIGLKDRLYPHGSYIVH